ncbi:hypothetical protein HYN59_16885 [Flavobacterium album]|uniref:Uncharacterized protein n=1 Tax=Flavobacterium album TaxID=2175091 RepID=A0A2S1R264_9FLAO|nr:hypothetical protein HYN59_16885 [Flavobacterium album]
MREGLFREGHKEDAKFREAFSIKRKMRQARRGFLHLRCKKRILTPGFTINQDVLSQGEGSQDGIHHIYRDANLNSPPPRAPDQSGQAISQGEGSRNVLTRI